MSVPGFIVDLAGRALVPLTGRDEPHLRLRLLSALPLPSRVLRAPLFLAAPDGAHVADPSDAQGACLVGWPQLSVARMVSAGRASITRSF
jgi:hypothetical protein